MAYIVDCKHADYSLPDIPRYVVDAELICKASCKALNPPPCLGDIVSFATYTVDEGLGGIFTFPRAQPIIEEKVGEGYIIRNIGVSEAGSPRGTVESHV